MENTYKEFQTKAQDYAAVAANQTEITNEARRKELESMQKNIQEFQQTVSQDLQKKSVDMMQPLIEKAKEAIDRVASIWATIMCLILLMEEVLSLPRAKTSWRK